MDFLDRDLLNSFDTQIQFVEKLREFFAKTLHLNRSLLLIQVELNQRYDNDLLACVRHLIVETKKELKLCAGINKDAHIALVVMVPRENVRNVSGFQFGMLILEKLFGKTN